MACSYDADDRNSDEGDAAPQAIEIPSTMIVISDEELAELHAAINPLDDSDDFGVNLYTATLELLQSFNLSS